MDGAVTILNLTLLVQSSLNLVIYTSFLCYIFLKF